MSFFKLILKGLHPLLSGGMGAGVFHHHWFHKVLEIGQNFEGVKRHTTKETEAVGLPEQNRLKGGAWVSSQAEKNKVAMGLESGSLSLPTKQRLWNLISSSANQA